MSPPEILVHVAAPSRGVDDARYRKEALGILAFQSVSRHGILTLDDDQPHGRFTQIQEGETSPTSQQNPRDSNETSYDPTPQHKVYQAFDRWATAFPPPVQKTKGDPKQTPALALPSTIIWSRPRVLIERTPADTRPRTAPSSTSVVQETPLLRRSLSDSFEAPPSFIPDSQPAVSSGEQGQSSSASPTHRTTQDIKPYVQSDHPSKRVESPPQARLPSSNRKGKRKDDTYLNDPLSPRKFLSSSPKRRRLNETPLLKNSALDTTERVAFYAPSAPTSSSSSSLYSTSPKYHVSPSSKRQAQNDRTSEKEKLALQKEPLSPNKTSKRKEGVPIVGTLATPELTTASRLRRRLSDTLLHGDLSPKIAAHIQNDYVLEKDKLISLEDSLPLSRRRLGMSDESTQEISTAQEHLSPGKKHWRRRHLSNSPTHHQPVSRLSRPLSSKETSSAPGSSSPLAAPQSFSPLPKSSAPASAPWVTSRRHSIHPPPPPTSLSPFTTHRTPTLAFLLTTCSSHTRISSYLSLICPTRAVHPLERGYWVFEYACERPPWSEGQAGKMRGFLEEVVGSGRAGWGVWCVIEKVGAGAGASGDGGEEDVSTCATEEGPAGEDGEKEKEKAQGEEMERVKVYCWGEVVREVWLVLFLASGRHIKGRGARWVDSGGRSIIRMI